MGAEQTKEAADIVQELEHVNVLAVVCINQAIIRPCHRSEDGSNHAKGEDCQPAASNPAVVYSVGSCIVSH